MNYFQLEHAIRAACDVADDTEVLVFGSQALLGTFHNPHQDLTRSIEVDIQPKNNTDMIDYIDGTLGEMSLFHQTHGFYVHGVSIEAATLPLDWESRVIPVMHEVGTRGNTGFCIEIHDLAASKLAAYREKDFDFVSTLIIEHLVDINILKERISVLDILEETRVALRKWVSAFS